VSDSKHSATKQYRIPESNIFASAWKMSAVVAVIGILVAVAGYTLQSERFAFSYLYGFVTVFTLWLGSVFFVLIQHLTGAGWSVTVRRAAEFFVSGVVVLPFLFLPLLTQLNTLYPWWKLDHGAVAEAQEHGDHAEPGEHAEHGEHAAHGGGHGHGHGGHARVPGVIDHHAPHELLEEAAIAKKGAFLNHGFFYLRALIYFGIWLWIGLRLFGLSTAQDVSGDKLITKKMAGFCAPATFLYALSLTFAAFDWVMSLEPGWYSTMFGVRFFATGAVTSFALVIVTTLGWKRAGLVGEEINTEHYHDLGKMMFGFLIFWAYVSFSEFMLIWYAAIPEETVYFHRRWDDSSWRILSIAIVTLKFIVPFYLIMSRNAKRNNAIIGFGAFWLLAMHPIEIYYAVMPYYKPFAPVQWNGVWMEAGCVMATVGVYVTYVLRKMNSHSLIAVGDPRLARSLDFQNP
jgi:hypothetical protein